MISQKTAYELWICYDEISKGEKLLETMQEALKQHKLPDLRDAFGQSQNLQLGVPSGSNSTRLLDVHPKLAVAVIKAHIADKRAQLELMNQQAGSEFNTTTLESPATK